MKIHEQRIKENLDRKSQFIDGKDQIQVNVDGYPLPSWIEFSPIDVCNRKCVFCPRVDDTTAPDNYNTTTPTFCYEKLFDELEVMGFSGTLMWSGYGEPLLAKNLTKVLSLVGGRFRTEVTTNGDALRPKKVKELFDAGLDYLVVSLYDGPEQIDEFHKMFKEASIERDRYLLRERWFSADDDFGVKLTNRTGTVTVGDQPDIDLSKKCFYPHYSCMIDWNGDFFLCPQDWNRRRKWGNVFIQGFDGVWFSKELTSARRRLAKGDRSASPCSLCNANGTLHGENHAKAWARREN